MNPILDAPQPSPKVATPWKKALMFPYTWYRRSSDGPIILVWREGRYGLRMDRPLRGLWLIGTKTDADEALKAAGWKLIGGSDV